MKPLANNEMIFNRIIFCVQRTASRWLCVCAALVICCVRFSNGNVSGAFSVIWIYNQNQKYDYDRIRAAYGRPSDELRIRSTANIVMSSPVSEMQRKAIMTQYTANCNGTKMILIFWPLWKYFGERNAWEKLWIHAVPCGWCMVASVRKLQTRIPMHNNVQCHTMKTRSNYCIMLWGRGADDIRASLSPSIYMALCMKSTYGKTRFAFLALAVQTIQMCITIWASGKAAKCYLHLNVDGKWHISRIGVIVNRTRTHVNHAKFPYVFYYAIS